MPLLTALVGFVAFQGGWKPYTLGPGLQVDLPSAPSPISAGAAKVEPGAGIWGCLHLERNSMVVGYFPLGKEGEKTASDEILRNTLAGFLRSTQSRITAQRDLLFEGWPGIEYRVTNSEGLSGISRTYIAKDAIVTLSMLGASAKGLDAPSTKLFASLKLPPATGKGILKVAGPEFKPHAIGEIGLTVNLPKPPKTEAIDLPGTPKRTLHRFSSEYLNRSYVVAYMDIPEEALDELDPEKLDAMQAAIHQDVIRSMQGENPEIAPAKTGSRDVLRTTVGAWNGAGHARIESFALGKRIVVLLAVVPTPLAKTPEVEGFFASAKTE